MLKTKVNTQNHFFLIIFLHFTVLLRLFISVVSNDGNNEIMLY